MRQTCLTKAECLAALFKNDIEDTGFAANCRSWYQFATHIHASIPTQQFVFQGPITSTTTNTM